jgi:hypothetical protein
MTAYHIEWSCCAVQQSRKADVRFGSKADIEARPTDVRFTPESGHCGAQRARLLCAKKRSCPTGYSIPVRAHWRAYGIRPAQAAGPLGLQCIEGVC